ERVKSEIKYLKNPSPDLALPDWNTALVTHLCRWSLSELPRSMNGKRLSCGSRVDCRSVESSIECDHVWLESSSKFLVNRLERFTVRALYQEFPSEVDVSTLLKGTGAPKPTG